MSWPSPHPLQRADCCAPGQTRKRPSLGPARGRGTRCDGEEALPSSPACSYAERTLGSDDRGRAANCRTRAACSRRPPFPGELSGAANAPRGSGDEQVPLADPTLTASWALAFWALAARLLQHRAASVGRVGALRCRIARKERPFARNPRPNTGACKTAQVARGSHIVRDSGLRALEPLGATRGGPLDRGQISPELALVDPVLAEGARELLPEPRELTRPRRPREEAAPSYPVGRVRPGALPTPAPRLRPRRWRRMVVLAVLIFVAGAAFGGLLGTKSKPRPDASRPLTIGSGASANGSSTTRTRVAALSPKRPASGRPHASHPRRLSHGGRSTATHERARRRAARPRSTSARNVLGVTAAVDRRGVRLVWQRPTHFDRVVVFRAQSSRERGVVVYRGRAGSFRDRLARPCTAYRYLIVNYDKAGLSSTGVPTSVLTAGCT